MIGSKPGTGMFWFPAVEAGISKTMLSTPGLGSVFASVIACGECPVRNHPYW